MVITVVAFSGKIYALNFVNTALSIAETALLIACFVASLSMKKGEILSVYCGGNVKCSIKSNVILPIITSACSVVPSMIATVKYYRAKKLLK